MSDKILEGIVDEITNQRTGKSRQGPWVLTEFKLVDGGGNAHKVQTFEEFTDDLIGAHVRLEVFYDKQYSTYKLADGTGIEVLEGVEVGAAVPATQQEAEPAPAIEGPKRRGRPTAAARTTTAAPATTAKSYEKNPPAAATTATEALTSSREDFRDAAVEAVALNLESARGVAKDLKLDVTSVQDLIAVADMIGRTQTAIFTDQQKDKRATAANANRNSYKKPYYGKRS